MSDPYQVVRDFEKALSAYTGAPYVVTTTSCTMALLLAVAYHIRWHDPYGKPMHLRGPVIGSNEVEIPKRTYIGVAMSILHAGGRPTFRDEEWEAFYRLKPLPVWDSARYFVSSLFPIYDVRHRAGQMICVSFHPTKVLGISTHGGAILHDDPEADAWLRRARFDGRAEGVAPKDDRFDVVGWHAYMTPPTAEEGLRKLATLPERNAPLPWGPGTDSDYPDLSQLAIFR